ncbi:MAG TPA: hypothetical protein VJN64_11720 [Terriglobales bacterium]|nr:hypothetical protein [Terriglobales bacterium]
MNAFQQLILNSKLAQVDAIPAQPALGSDTPPPNAVQFILTTQVAVPYPAAGAAAATLLSYTVPRGQGARVQYLAIEHIGGGQIDMSGNVIWRVLINGYPHKGMGAMQAQVGSFTFPNKVVIELTEADTLSITAEVPAAAPAPPVGMSSAARIHGWTFTV